MENEVEGNKIASWWKFVLGHTGKYKEEGPILTAIKPSVMGRWNVPQDVTVPQEAQRSLATSISLLLCHHQLPNPLGTSWLLLTAFYVLASVFTAIGIFPHFPFPEFTTTALACMIPGSPRPGIFWWFKQKTPREDYYWLFLGHMIMAEPITWG